MTSEAGATTGASVEREIRIEASPETVWGFLVEPEKIQRWQGVAAEVDLRPGGKMRIDMHGDRDIAVGEYVTVEPHSRLVYTWGWEDNAEFVPPGSSTGEVTLEPDGSGTLVRLQHRDLPNEEAAQGHGEGWTHYLDRLAIAATGGDPGPDTLMDGNDG